MNTRIVINSSILFLLLLVGGSCKHDPPTGIHTCDTCNIDTSHHTTSNDSTSHNFTWAQSTISGEAGLTGCWVFGPRNIYVVGGGVHKYDGVSWKNVSPNSIHGSLDGLLSGSSMFAFSEGDYWLTDGFPIRVGNGVGIEHRMDSLGNPYLHSSWGTSSSNMYSVGDGGTILHFDGTKWTKMQSGTIRDLVTIWGTNGNNIWAGGFKNSTDESVLLHYDGISWHSIDLSTVGNISPHAHVINAAWTVDSAGTSLAATAGTSLWRTSNGTQWRCDSSLLPNSLQGNGFVTLYYLHGNSINDYVAEGSWGWVGHWNGRSWKRFDELYDPQISDFLAGGIHIKDNTICAVGEKNGQAWIAIGQRK